jgi:hypothetical protein
MSQPASRQGLLDYCLRKLGYPVLEINVDEDQLNDRLDDALQYFQERHFDGIERVFLKHKILSEEKDIITKTPAYTTATTPTTTSGITSSVIEEAQNYIPLPDTVIGVNMVFKSDSNTLSGGMFNIKYQIFLNDLYYYGALDLLNYSMTKTYLEDISRIITPDVQLRFNKKQHRLYLDIDWQMVSSDSYIIIDCYRIVDPANFPAVYNDYWLKKYLSSSIKKQWGQNLIKFNGVQLPGGITMNGEKIYADAEKELEEIERQLRDEYELPPLGLIG